MIRSARIVLLAALLALLTTVPAAALKPVRDYAAVPSDYGIVYRDVTFPARDGLRIHGWFIPAQDTAGIARERLGQFPLEPEQRCAPRPYAARDARPGPTVVICDGDAINMTQFIVYAYELCTRGFNVLTFDWRGFGSSSDWPTDPDHLCYTEYLDDCDAALDFVKRQPEVDPARIGIFGASTGAYLSFAVTARRDDVAAYAARALMSSFDEVLVRLKRIKPDRRLVAPADYPADLQPLAAASRVRIPVLLIVGERDDRTPPSMSRRVLARLRGPKELWVARGAAHGGEDGPEGRYYEEFFDRLARFYRRNL